LRLFSDQTVVVVDTLLQANREVRYDGNGTTYVKGVLNQVYVGYTNYITNNHQMIIAGNATIQCYMQIQSGSTLTILSTGRLDTNFVNQDMTWQGISGVGVINNMGSFRKIGANYRWNIQNMQVNNMASATFHLYNGYVTFASTASLNLDAASVTYFHISGATLSTNYCQLQLSSLAANGILRVGFEGFTPTIGQVYTLITYGANAYSGSFTLDLQPTTVHGTIAYTSTSVQLTITA